jgi:hypothetical protein
MSPDSPTFFLSADKAESLAVWKSAENNVASLHLPVDDSGLYPATLDRLIREAEAGKPGVHLAKRDLDLISAFVRSSFVPGARRGLCVYSCAKYGVFEAFGTPETLAPSLTISKRPYLRPLNDLRARYYRFLSLQADERGARFTQIHLGESSIVESVTGNFKGAGLAALAKRAAALYREHRADRLVVGSEPELIQNLEPLLEPELQNRLIHEPLLGPDRPVEAVVERVRHNELSAQKLREDVLVSHFLVELKAGGAVAGLERVADALQQGCVKRLLVRDGWAKMGRCCTGCGRLSVDHRSCPWCFRPTDSILDIVGELSDRASAAGVDVFRVAHDPRFDGVGRIGAELAAPSKPALPAAPAKVGSLKSRFALKGGRPSPLRPR